MNTCAVFQEGIFTQEKRNPIALSLTRGARSGAWALRRYLLSADAKPGELLALARQLRIGSVVSAAMEPLLA